MDIAEAKIWFDWSSQGQHVQFENPTMYIFELFCFERFVISDESMFRSDMDWPSSRNAATSVNHVL